MYLMVLLTSAASTPGIDAAVAVIGSLGFPIAMCCAMFWYLTKQAQNHKEEVSTLTEVINKNTVAIERLCEKLDK